MTSAPKADGELPGEMVVLSLQAADYRAKSQTDWRVDARAAISVGRAEIGALSMLDMSATPSRQLQPLHRACRSKPTDRGMADPPNLAQPQGQRRLCTAPPFPGPTRSQRG
jgi:hypothetical protein